MAANTDKIHIPASQRGFGLGFGAYHQIMVYTKSGPKTGAVFSHPSRSADVAAWLAGDNQRALTAIIPPDELSGALQNLLVHADTIELVRVLPKMLAHMDTDARAQLFGRVVKKLSPEIWYDLVRYRPYLEEQGLHKLDPQPYFARLSEAGEGAKITHNTVRKKRPLQDGSTQEYDDPYDDITFNGVSMEAVANILPALFEALDENARVRVTQAMAEALHACGEDKQFFNPLADSDRNRLIITDDKTGPCSDIINNGRTLMIRSDKGPKVRFQGDDFITSNLHFHPLSNPDDSLPKNNAGEVDAKPEFRRYESPEHRTQCTKKGGKDPNIGVVGQLHTIYVTPDKRRAMLLGADVVLGDPNPAIGQYIGLLKKKKGDEALEIINDTNDFQEIKTKAVPAGEITSFNPLASYSGKFDQDGVPEAPFMSLQLGGLKVHSLDNPQLKEGQSSIFYRGVRVIHLPETITVSPEQFADLRRLQPTLKQIDEETCVHPGPRYQPLRERLQTLDKKGPMTAGR